MALSPVETGVGPAAVQIADGPLTVNGPSVSGTAFAPLGGASHAIAYERHCPEHAPLPALVDEYYSRIAKAA